MSENTKRIILEALYNKENYGNDYDKASEVLLVLEEGIHTHTICEGIFNSAIEVMKRAGKTDTESLLAVLTTPFCIDYAYNYILFLQNSHELHEAEKPIL